jgi:glucosamine--fructose-6-phosphate aminotransferase (isomerizing)
MCGIIGVVAPNPTNVVPFLMDGLKRLEYRGYDSAGIATLSAEGDLLCRRSEGKLRLLEENIKKSPIKGDTGIGHTRWATHGKPTTNNAHPHSTSKVAVVHNGIIENFRELRIRLETAGRVLTSDTDTEVIPHLITQFLEEGMEPEEAVREATRLLSGTFALGIIFAGREQLILAARRGSPLAIGHGNGEMYIGSDAIALAPFTSRISYLEDGDIAQVRDTGVMVWDDDNKLVKRTVHKSEHSGAVLGKNGYRHFMLKEINEQPAVLGAALRKYIDTTSGAIHLPAMPFDLRSISQITLVGCGTSHYAGMIGKYWIEKYTHIPVTIDIASEFRYRNAPLAQGELALFISQSGETADTLAALNFCRDAKQNIMSIVNVSESTMAIASDVMLPTLAGAEIGVASTKAFTTQLMVLACLTLELTKLKNTLNAKERNDVITALTQLPALVMNALAYEEVIRELARTIMHAKNILYIGRGTSYAVALEGALKLKELTYIHAEGVAAGELKHGPIALIDENMPVIALAPSDSLFEKTCSNIQEVTARGGKVIVFCGAEGAKSLKDIVWQTIILPETHPLLTPFIYTIPLQLLAYHVAIANGNDVDQPRNLAKSVTVE